MEQNADADDNADQPCEQLQCLIEIVERSGLMSVALMKIAICSGYESAHGRDRRNDHSERTPVADPRDKSVVLHHSRRQREAQQQCRNEHDGAAQHLGREQMIIETGKGGADQTGDEIASDPSQQLRHQPGHEQ